jgi:hypothetical protein
MDLFSTNAITMTYRITNTVDYLHLVWLKALCTTVLHWVFLWTLCSYLITHSLSMGIELGTISTAVWPLVTHFFFTSPLCSLFTVSDVAHIHTISTQLAHCLEPWTSQLVVLLELPHLTLKIHRFNAVQPALFVHDTTQQCPGGLHEIAVKSHVLSSGNFMMLGQCLVLSPMFVIIRILLECWVEGKQEGVG